MFSSTAIAAHSPYTPNPQAAKHVSRQVFGSHWHVAACIAYYESRYELGAVNGANRGPWQINVTAHPWVNASRLTSSWRYSARVAYEISHGGKDWTPWSTYALCGD